MSAVGKILVVAVFYVDGMNVDLVNDNLRMNGIYSLQEKVTIFIDRNVEDIQN